MPKNRNEALAKRYAQHDKYRKEKLIRKLVSINHEKNPELAEYISSITPFSPYVIGLIKEDMERKKKSK